MHLNLRSLNLANTDIGGDELKQLGKFLKFYRQLEILTLSANHLGGAYLKSGGNRYRKKVSPIQKFSTALTGYQSLRELNIDDIDLDDKDSTNLIMMMDSFGTFVHLSFANNPGLTSKYRQRLEESLQHARGRAELLGAPWSETTVWKDKISRFTNYFSASHGEEGEKEAEKEAEKEISDNEEAISWEQLYALSEAIINEFLPSTERHAELQHKLTAGKPFSSFEELQLCAITAKAKLKSIRLTQDLSVLLNIFATFIFHRKLNNFLTALTATPNLFEKMVANLSERAS